MLFLEKNPATLENYHLAQLVNSIKIKANFLVIFEPEDHLIFEIANPDSSFIFMLKVPFHQLSRMSVKQRRFFLQEVHISTCLGLSQLPYNFTHIILDFIFQFVIFKIWMFVHQIHHLFAFGLVLWIVPFTHLISLIQSFDTKIWISCVLINTLNVWAAVFTMMAECFAVADVPFVLDIEIVEFFDGTNYLFMADELLFEIESDTILCTWFVI